MKETLSTSQVADRLYEDRHNAGWSWAGAHALAEHLEELEQDMGEEMEMDVVAIRCEYSEYESATDAASNYSDFEADEDADAEDVEAAALEFLNDNTSVVEFSGGVIIRDF